MRKDRWIAKINACRVAKYPRFIPDVVRYRSRVSFNSCKHIMCEQNILVWRSRTPEEAERYMSEKEFIRGK